MGAGRPTDYNDEVLRKAQEYLAGGYTKNGAVVPSVAGLAVYLNTGKKNLYNWGEKYPEFLHTLDNIQRTQEHLLINNGLVGDFNSTITKLMLSNHGYRESSQTDITSSDGSLPTTINFVRPEKD